MRSSLFLITLPFLIGCAGNKGITNSYSQEQIPFEEQYWNLIIEKNEEPPIKTREVDPIAKKEDTIPKKPVNLEQKHPNPFWPTTDFHFEVFEAGNVELILYDLEGRKIGSVAADVERPGEYTAKSNGVNVNSGIFFYEVIFNGIQIERKKFMYLK